MGIGKVGPLETGYNSWLNLRKNDLLNYNKSLSKVIIFRTWKIILFLIFLEIKKQVIEAYPGIIVKTIILSIFLVMEILHTLLIPGALCLKY